VKSKRAFTLKQIQARAEEVLGVSLKNDTLADTVVMLCNEVELLVEKVAKLQSGKPTWMK
jgi:hypothetical protein